MEVADEDFTALRHRSYATLDPVAEQNDMIFAEMVILVPPRGCQLRYGDWARKVEDDLVKEASAGMSLIRRDFRNHRLMIACGNRAAHIHIQSECKRYEQAVGGVGTVHRC